METIINFYYKDNAKKLRAMVDQCLFKLKFHNIDYDDFYSLANEIFVKEVLPNYISGRNFDDFLYSCLERKFKTEMTRRNRYKRQADRMSISWETPIGEDGSETIGDRIMETKRAIHYDIDDTFFSDETGDKYSEKMLKYLKRLSKTQKEIVKLIIAGYEGSEIKEMLHLTNKQYSDCLAAIRSYRNISILF